MLPLLKSDVLPQSAIAFSFPSQGLITNISFSLSTFTQEKEKDPQHFPGCPKVFFLLCFLRWISLTTSMLLRQAKWGGGRGDRCKHGFPQKSTIFKNCWCLQSTYIYILSLDKATTLLVIFLVSSDSAPGEKSSVLNDLSLAWARISWFGSALNPLHLSRALHQITLPRSINKTT